ncbi:CFDP1 [Symbiodinium natans]|uniref:CFDP1 protein n=1 Tax=Symbiodinium natans TaxID=878477 RepID=A0A812M6S8_9DINO|nr:CFDP1 [Symbiodinium natans]
MAACTHDPGASLPLPSYPRWCGGVGHDVVMWLRFEVQRFGCLPMLTVCCALRALLAWLSGSRDHVALDPMFVPACDADLGIVVNRPVLVSFWVFGLLIAAFAGGLPVATGIASQKNRDWDSTRGMGVCETNPDSPKDTHKKCQKKFRSQCPDANSATKYSTMLQQAEVIDSRELGQQAMTELQKAEAAYYSQSGLFGCSDDDCKRAYDKDLDYEAKEEPAPKRRRVDHGDAQRGCTRSQRADQTWAEMQQQEAQESKKWPRRPHVTLPQPTRPKAKSVPAQNCLAVVAQIAKYGQVKDADEHLSVRDLKKRSRAEAGTTTSSVVRPAPSVSKSDVLAEVVKLNNLSAGAVPSTAEVKRKVRWTKEELSAQSQSSGLPKMRTVQVQESVKFAGETLTVNRELVLGSAAERQFLLSQKRRQSAKLGGKFAALDNLLRSGKDKVLNTMEKSELDWQQHQKEAGLEDLGRDPQAGYIERAEFLRRAKLRASEAIRDAVEMARAEVARVQKHRDRVLSEGRQEVGIWSSFGVQAMAGSRGEALDAFKQGVTGLDSVKHARV